MQTVMRGTLLLACAAILCLTPFVQADTMDDLSWFGNTGATSNPVKDDDQPGYWWWPTNPKSNVDDSEVWGNRGVIYPMFTHTPPPPPPAPPAKITEAPAVERSVPIFNHVLFDFDKSNVKSEGVTEIKKIAAALNANSGDKVTVEGHTDNVNRSGDPQYNQKLGQRRADAISKVLTDNGVNANRITAVSKGDSDPAVPNSSDANRKLNRRIVFKVQISN
jgi:outer membrane protein OmpA-like peptidoglycan-associated protein